MTPSDIGEIFKNLSGVVSSALVVVDSKYPILPINPRLHQGLVLVSIILAAVAGFGGRQFAQRSGRLALGWSFLAVAVLVLGLLLWLSSDPASLSPNTIRSLARFGYVLFFLFLGGAFGGFLRT